MLVSCAGLMSIVNNNNQKKGIDVSNFRELRPLTPIPSQRSSVAPYGIALMIYLDLAIKIGFSRCSFTTKNGNFKANTSFLEWGCFRCNCYFFFKNVYLLQKLAISRGKSTCQYIQRPGQMSTHPKKVKKND